MITEEELINAGFVAGYLPEDENGRRVESQFEYFKGKVLVGLSNGVNYVYCISDLTTDSNYASTAHNVKNISDLLLLCKLLNPE